MNPEKEAQVEAWFERRRLTLDLFGLTEDQIKENSFMLGGEDIKIVTPDDSFNYNQVNTIVFGWGDHKVEDIFSIMFEHDDVPDKRYSPFDVSAIINGQLWKLSLQSKHFAVRDQFSSEEEYKVIPFDKSTGSEELNDYLSLPTPRPELLAKIGTRWLVFEVGTNLDPSVEQSTEFKTFDFLNPPENTEIPQAEIIEHIRAAIDIWDFDNPEHIDATRWYALNITHWLLETFGRAGRDNSYSLITDQEGFKGVLLPRDMRHLVMNEWGGELYLSDGNKVIIKTNHDNFETDPVIPQWENICDLPTFDEQLEYMQSHPEIIKGIIPTRVETIPQVSLQFEPDYDYKWGIEFIVNQVKIEAAPYGQAGHTRTAQKFVSEYQAREGLLAKNACLLALAASQYTHYPKANATVDSLQLKKLSDRLHDKDTIPLSHTEYQPAPKNAIKIYLSDDCLKIASISHQNNGSGKNRNPLFLPFASGYCWLVLELLLELVPVELSIGSPIRPPKPPGPPCPWPPPMA